MVYDNSPIWGASMVRPFHPKQPGHNAIKNILLDAIKDAEIGNTICGAVSPTRD
jgi:hypothetical protein